MASPQPIPGRRLAANRANARKSAGPRTAASNRKRAGQTAAKSDHPIPSTLHRALWITHGHIEFTRRIEDGLYMQSRAAYPHDAQLAEYVVLQQYRLPRAIYRHHTHYTRIFFKIADAIAQYASAQKKLARIQAKQASGAQSNPSHREESAKSASGTQTKPPHGEESTKPASGTQTNPPHGEQSAKPASGTRTNPSRAENAKLASGTQTKPTPPESHAAALALLPGR